MKQNINFTKLTHTFPDYTWARRTLDLVGLHKSGLKSITIADGMCTSNDSTWIVFIYSFTEKEDSPLTCPKYRNIKHVEQRMNLV